MPLRIPRLHWFELEDQAWFPATIRDLSTDYLRFLGARFALHRPAVALVANTLRKTGTTRLVDLCSGGGGPIVGLIEDLAEPGLTVLLTDRFPNHDAFQQIAANSKGRISFREEPVDARRVPREADGFRTLFNAFHHFRPEDARAVLRDAADAKQGIGIFEIPDRTWRVLLPMIFFTPLMVAVATPFIRPFRWRRLFWTYVLPFVPMTCWWDGIVSQLRAYTVSELEQLARAVGATGYCWEAGKVPIGSAPGYLTYLIGYPKPESRTGSKV
jgi:hypothetical protein